MQVINGYIATLNRRFYPAHELSVEIITDSGITGKRYALARMVGGGRLTQWEELSALEMILQPLAQFLEHGVISPDGANDIMMDYFTDLKNEAIDREVQS